MSNNKKYWKNLAELDSANDNVFDKLQNKEFVEEIPVDEFLSDKDNLANSSCLLYTSPSPRDKRQSRMPSSA